MEYGNKFKTRPIITENVLQVVELMNSVSWRMNDQWTFGVGLGILHGSFEQKQDLPSLSDTAVDDITSVVEFVGLAQECSGRPVVVAACRAAALAQSGLNPVSAADTLNSLNSYMVE
jgi:long-subunit fatty acid transport protein